MAKPTGRKKRQPIAKRFTQPVMKRRQKRLVPKVPTGLTVKEQRFVEEYCVDLNAKQAAIRAGYSKKSAKEIGYENLTKPHLADAIQDYKRRLAERVEITKEQIVRNLTPLAHSNILDYTRQTEDGDLVSDFSAINRDQGAAVCEYTTEEYTDGRGEDARDVKRIKFKLYDRRAANMDLAKLLGHVTDKVQTEVTVTKKDECDRDAKQLTNEQLDARIAVLRRKAAEADAEIAEMAAGE